MSSDTSAKYILELEQNNIRFTDDRVLETGILPNDVLFAPEFHNSTVYSSIRCYKSRRIVYRDRAGPVIKAAYWNNNACMENIKYNSLVVTFSEQVGFNDTLIDNNNNPAFLDMLFNFFFENGLSKSFRGASITQFTASADSVEIQQRVWEPVPLVRGGGMEITLAATANTDSLVWDQFALPASEHNLPHTKTRKVTIVNNRGDALVCEATVGLNTPFGADVSADAYSTDPIYKSEVYTNFFITITDTAVLYINIFDLLGNKVREMRNDDALTMYDFSEVGSVRITQIWDHRNEKGRWVAKGGYIVLIKANFVKKKRIITLPPIRYCYK